MSIQYPLLNSCLCSLHVLPTDYHTLPGTLQNLNAKIRSAVIRVFNSTLDVMDDKLSSLLLDGHNKEWDFMEYYLCLEEMSSLYSCMSLYEEALECMERAENRLTIELSKAAEKGVTNWVKSMLSISYDRLIKDPTIISTYENPERLELVHRRKANLFELRAHILTRECALLQALDRISELPHRAVRTIRLCTKEARDLRIPVPAFQLYFWTFLTSLQTLDIFRRGTRCVPKTEDFINLRRKFLHTYNLLHYSPTFTANSSTGTNSSNILSADEDSNGPSNISDLRTSTLLSAKYKALESLDLLEDVSLKTEGTFSILARAVLASVVADYHVRHGRRAAQNQDLVGTSRWTVDLWRRACIALSRLGRSTDLWPDPIHRQTRGVRPDSLNGAMLISIMEMFNSSANISTNVSSDKHLGFGGSFGAQLSIAFISSESFEEVYRKFAGACIFFQSCSGAKRGSTYMSLELADFYRDRGNFLNAESLYHQATKIFLKESWTELATYSLLQQAFCQQVQWRTENVDSIESSVFRRYVQTALLLAITPATILHYCYDLLKRRGAYFGNLFGEGAIDFDATSAEKVAILPPWWPEDWWAHALETVAEHFARTASPAAISTSPENLTLRRPLVPLSVHSLWPLFRLHALDLEEANPHTHRQVIRLHLRLIGVRPMLVKVSVGARPTTIEDWSKPPLSRGFNDKQGYNSAKFFNVDMASEGARSGIIASNSDSHLIVPKDGSLHRRQSTEDRDMPFSSANTPLIPLLEPSGTKESVIQRLFRRSSTGGRPTRQLFKKKIASSSDMNGEVGHIKRPTSIDFLSYRGRLNTLDKVAPLPQDSILDGLALTADDDRSTSIPGLTSENASAVAVSVFSDSAAVRRHKKGLSLSDLSSFAAKIWRNETPEKSNNRDSNGQNGPIITTKAIVLDSEVLTSFYSRCHSTNPFHCKLPNTAKYLIEDEGDAITFDPGDNYLVLETMTCGFYLPTEIKIYIYNDAESANADMPCFVFSSILTPEHFSSTWSSEPLLRRLLPRVEQIEAIRLSTIYKVPQAQDRGTSATVMSSMNQPVFLTVRVGDLSIEHSSNGLSDQTSGNGSISSDTHVRLLRKPNNQPASIWKQRYTVDPPEEEEDEGGKTSSWNDLGPLVVAPGEKPPTSSKEYPPGTRLCPLQSFLLRPKPNEQVSIVLPTGRPYPIDFLYAGILIFNVKVSRLQGKEVLIQLRVAVRDSTWPVLGSVDEKESSPHLNPFYCQERIAFRLSAPKLVLRPSPDAVTPSLLPSLPSTPAQTSAVWMSGHSNPMRPTLLSGPQRSISVVEFAPPSPAMLATVATASRSGLVNAADNKSESGHSFFSLSKDEESLSTGSGDKDSTADSEDQAPIQLVESSDYEGIVSYGRPITVAWIVQWSYFKKFSRPTPKSESVGVIADFSFLVGSKFDAVRPLINDEKSSQQNGFGAFFARSAQKK
ncbi:hypothetical protein Aperf_G00000026623 [Anoplocephala perfoliata]